MAQIFNHIKDTVQQSIDALVKNLSNLKQLEKQLSLYLKPNQATSFL